MTGPQARLSEELSLPPSPTPTEQRERVIQSTFSSRSGHPGDSVLSPLSHSHALEVFQCAMVTILCVVSMSLQFYNSFGFQK